MTMKFLKLANLKAVILSTSASGLSFYVFAYASIVVCVLLSGTNVVRLRITQARDIVLKFSDSPSIKTLNRIDASLYNEAERESFGYFDDIPNAKWDFQRERSRSIRMWTNPTNPSGRLQQKLFGRFHVENVFPNFNCMHLIRVGNLGEGAKWICDPHRLSKYADCLVYSIGSYGNFTFEYALNDLVGDKNCEIHVFDPDPKRLKEGDTKERNIHYHLWGVRPERTEIGSQIFKSFNDTLVQLKHVDRRLDIVNIDCNGCEWVGYKDWLFGSADIRQIVVRTHAGEVDDISVVSFFNDILNHGYVIYSKEAITSPGPEPFGSVYEWSFIKLNKTFGKYGYGNLERLKNLTLAAAKNENYSEQYKDAFDDSYGFFDDILNVDWEAKRQHAKNAPIFSSPNDRDFQLRENPGLWHMNNMYPIFSCPNLLRVAGLGDGPKWICDPERLNKHSDCLIYSVGSRGNYMFENAIIDLLGNTNCEIHVFDPNPNFEQTNDNESNNIHYHAWGLKSSYNKSFEFGGYTFKTFQESVSDLDHVGRRIDIFKIDCEGCEWNLYKDFLTEMVDIRQIAIETHARSARSVSVGNFFSDLYLAGYVLYSREANTIPPDSKGALYEWSLIKLNTSFTGVDKLQTGIQ